MAKKPGLTPKQIPITEAKRVSEATGFQEIIIFGYDPETGLQHLTTYGKTKAQCKDAGKASEFLQKALRWNNG